MLESVVAEQEIATHVFAPLDGVPADAGLTSLAGMWDRFRALQRADRQVFAEVPVALPDVLPDPAPHRSVPLAAVQSRGRLDQAVLRRNQDVLNLSLLLGAAPDRSWPDLERRVAEIVGPLGPAHLGAVTLLLGKRTDGDTEALELSPTGRADDSDPLRRLRLVVPAGQDDRLGAWAWSAGDGAEMPLFVRYLMHMTSIRYQLAVHSGLRGGWALTEGPPPRARIRVPFATGSGYRELVDPVEQLRAMQHYVEGAWDNACQALAACGTAPDSGPAESAVLADDRMLVTWFTHVLEDDVTHAELGKRQPEPESDGGSGTPRTATAKPASSAVRVPGASRGRAVAGAGEGPVAGAGESPVAGAGESPVAGAGESPVAGAGESPVRVLAVADEWFPAHGGLSTLNRRLCTALAEAGADVAVLVVASSEQERADARRHGIRLLDSGQPGHTGRESLMRRPRLPEGWVPDLVIGHGRVTGPAARAQAEDHFPGARRLQFLHVEPDQAEWHRTHPEGDIGAIAEERTELEFALCRGASRTVAVGPRLEAALNKRRRLPGFEDLAPPLRLDPGFDVGPTSQGAPPPDEVPQILVMGRLGEAIGKGLDIACGAVGRAAPEGSRPGKWQLVIRGARDGHSPDLYDRAAQWVDRSAVDLHVLPYSPDPAQIQRDVAGAALVLMPSRAEAFGLVGLEAIVAGVPVLVSGRSGLGGLLRGILPEHEAERVVVDVEAFSQRVEDDVARWAGAVSQVMFDLRGAFVRAEELQKEMASRLPWSVAAHQVLGCAREADRRG
ncbi:CATRA conflict system CASPASE/TPR repeat-associated protein [Streptomyces sp. NPDC127072]|uniref:CATRA conflict system CASPASE/TPR repeat-associated protein n=1 Tax=Streptomyces sp. NPDC127072 TaxID=3347129 RepID=UPI00365F9236